MVFGWFKSENRKRRQKVRLDRKHLEARTRRFLQSYLTADKARKARFYQAVEDASKECQPTESSQPSPELSDAQIAEATSETAMKIVLAREKGDAPSKDGPAEALVTDSYATVAIAYHRAAGVYAMDQKMQELGRLPSTFSRWQRHIRERRKIEPRIKFRSLQPWSENA